MPIRRQSPLRLFLRPLIFFAIFDAITKPFQAAAFSVFAAAAMPLSHAFFADFRRFCRRRCRHHCHYFHYFHYAAYYAGQRRRQRCRSTIYASAAAADFIFFAALAPFRRVFLLRDIFVIFAADISISRFAAFAAFFAFFDTRFFAAIFRLIIFRPMPHAAAACRRRRYAIAFAATTPLPLISPPPRRHLPRLYALFTLLLPPPILHAADFTP